MLIYGTRSISSSKHTGQFYCPRCGSQPYDLKSVRRFFTLYFIPLIPLDKLGEYVECLNCRESFDKRVLEYDPGAIRQEFESEFRKAMRATMIAMCLADGDVDDSEVKTIQSVYAKLAGDQLPLARLRAEIEAAKSSRRCVIEYLGEVALRLNDEGKELVLRCAFLVAAADGEFANEERHFLAEIAKALGVSKAHLQAIVEEMTGTPA
ncbi:MAG: TerB family tellurite resistance protein [Nannocystaceae bacterium]